MGFWECFSICLCILIGCNGIETAIKSYKYKGVGKWMNN